MERFVPPTHITQADRHELTLPYVSGDREIVWLHAFVYNKKRQSFIGRLRTLYIQIRALSHPMWHVWEFVPTSEGIHIYVVGLRRTKPYKQPGWKQFRNEQKEWYANV